MTDEQKQALNYIATALNDFANTMAPSIKGPFLREAQAAIKALEDAPKADPPKAE